MKERSAECRLYVWFCRFGYLFFEARINMRVSFTNTEYLADIECRNDIEKNEKIKIKKEF